MADGMNEKVNELQALQEERANLEKERRRLEEERIKIEKARIHLEEERIKKARAIDNSDSSFQSDGQKQYQKDPEILKIIEEQHKKQEKREKNHRINFFLLFVVGVLAITAVVLIRMNNGENIEDILPVGERKQAEQKAPEIDTSGVSPELVSFFESYEAILDSYYEAMTSKSTLVSTVKLAEMLSEYTRMAKEAEAIGETKMNDVDRRYYTKAMARIASKSINRLAEG